MVAGDRNFYKLMTENTSISVTHEVRDRVKQFADFKDETYSSILNRIMDDSEEFGAL